jgi:hypothetical protein
VLEDAWRAAAAATDWAAVGAERTALPDQAFAELLARTAVARAASRCYREGLFRFVRMASLHSS